MKKGIKYVVFSVIIICIAYFAYVNSKSYKYKMAIERRNARIEKLNLIPRHYLAEGVYNFDGKAYKINSKLDKFGETITSTENIKLGKGEVSLKSDKIVILFNGIREEFILGEPTLITYQLTEYSTGYSFPIIQWSAFNDSNNNCFFRFDSIENQKLRTNFNRFFKEGKYIPVHLILEISEHKRKENNENYSTLQIIGQHELGGLPSTFNCLSGTGPIRSSIDIDNLVYKYNDYRPSYFNAEYGPDVYDVSKYIY